MRILITVILLLASSTLLAFAQPAYVSLNCGDPYDTLHGPYDYAAPSEKARQQLPLVEAYHFTRVTETLGKSDRVAKHYGNLHYTLRVFPNHHRALNTLSRLSRLAPVPPGKRDSVMHPDCYFERAVKFRPEDPVVRLLYGIHLHMQKKLPQAQKHYEKALAIEPNYVEAHYNLGLLYFDMQHYDKAREEAKFAYERGYPLDGLKNKLSKVKP